MSNRTSIVYLSGKEQQMAKNTQFKVLKYSRSTRVCVYYDVVVLNPYADLKILSLQRFIQFKNSRGFHIKSD